MTVGSISLCDIQLRPRGQVHGIIIDTPLIKCYAYRFRSSTFPSFKDIHVQSYSSFLYSIWAHACTDPLRFHFLQKEKILSGSLAVHYTLIKGSCKLQGSTNKAIVGCPPDWTGALSPIVRGYFRPRPAIFPSTFLPSSLADPLC